MCFEVQDISVQVTAGVCSCEVCDQHDEGEQEELTGTTAASQLQPPGKTSKVIIHVVQVLLLSW